MPSVVSVCWLAAVQEKQQQSVQVISDCDPPSARVNASFVPYVTPVRAPRCVSGRSSREQRVVEHAERRNPLPVLLHASFHHNPHSVARRSFCLVASTATWPPARSTSTTSCSGSTPTSSAGARRSFPRGEWLCELLSRGLRQREANSNLTRPPAYHHACSVGPPPALPPMCTNDTQPHAALCAPGVPPQGVHVRVGWRVQQPQPGKVHALQVRWSGGGGASACVHVWHLQLLEEPAAHCSLLCVCCVTPQGPVAAGPHQPRVGAAAAPGGALSAQRAQVGERGWQGAAQLSAQAATQQAAVESRGVSSRRSVLNSMPLAPSRLASPITHHHSSSLVITRAHLIRMVALKGGKVLLFGGFYDTGRDVK